MESTSDLWSHKRMAPKSCLCRMTLPMAWFTARNACCLYHCCPDRNYTQQQAIRERQVGSGQQLCLLTFNLEVLLELISSKNCIFKMTRGSILGGKGRPVMMTARPKVSAKSRPSLACQKTTESQRLFEVWQRKSCLLSEINIFKIPIEWRQNWNVFLKSSPNPCDLEHASIHPY